MKLIALFVGGIAGGFILNLLDGGHDWRNTFMFCSGAFAYWVVDRGLK